ncbi:MAG: permease prefix domain 1-containing protein [Micropruina sp.]|uniref:permease prefix domain 1-containing protein n=1 Tax=Micropruina sp. TaxID=2737536 RepID=UPI0039E53AF6
MNDPIDDYCDALRAELNGASGTDDTLTEVEDHLREAADALTRQGTDPDAAARQAVQRFGTPALIGRRLRAEHGRPLPSDPAPASRLTFGITALLLLLASAAAASATYLHWLPCGGGAVTPDWIDPACLARMDTSAAFPLAPEAAERSPAADGFRLAALTLIALAWTLFATGQPWRPIVRWFVALPAVPVAALAVHTLVLALDPAAEPQEWTRIALHAVDIFAFVALGAMTAPLHPGLGREPRTAAATTMTYTTFRWSAALMLIAITTSGLFWAFADYAFAGGLTGLNWDTGPGAGYLSSGIITVAAVSSLLVARFGPRTRSAAAYPETLTLSPIDGGLR